MVVGIGYPNGEDYDLAARTLDYTPPLPGTDGTDGTDGKAGTAAESGGKSGGAERFLDFINLELKPLVRQLAPLNAQRQALFGHSFGGLFVLHTLFHHPASFQTYVAASPSIWWGGRQVLAGLDGLAQRSGGTPRLLLTVGQLEQAAPPRAPDGGPAAAVPAASTAVSPAAAVRDRVRSDRRMVDEARNLAEALQAAQPAPLARVRYIELGGENHGSALFPALSRGLEFFLEETAK